MKFNCFVECIVTSCQSSCVCFDLHQESWLVLSPTLGFGADEFNSFEFDYFERCTPEHVSDYSEFLSVVPFLSQNS